MSPRLAGLLVLTLLFALGYVGFLAVASARRTDRASAYQRGETALQSIVLPPGVSDAQVNKFGGTSSGCAPTPDTRCLHTATAIGDIHPLLDQLVVGGHDGCVLQTDPCAVYGELGGQGAVVIAFKTVDIPKYGRLRPGVIPEREGSWSNLGTDITVGLTQS